MRGFNMPVIESTTMVALYSKNIQGPLVTNFDNLSRFMGRDSRIAVGIVRHSLEIRGEFETADLRIVLVP